MNKKRIMAFLIITTLLFSCTANTNNSETETESPSSQETTDATKETTDTTKETPDATQTDTENDSKEAKESEDEIPPVSENVVTDEGFDQLAPPKSGETIAVMKTSKGDIKIKFFEEDAPKAVENFLTHAKDGYYDGLTFCRVIENFVIQSGSPTNDSRGGDSIWGEPFEDEFSARLHNYRGALSMANSGQNTNGSQFFIVQAGPVEEAFVEYLQTISDYKEAMYQDSRTLDIISGAQRFTKKAVETYKTVGGTPPLDGGFPSDPEQRSWHTVFGQVFEGMDVVDVIASGATNEQDAPIDPVKIESVEVTTY